MIVFGSKTRGPLLFFFSSRRRHTRLQGDWSSDVCSSDLDRAQELAQEALELAERLEEGAGIAESHVWLGRIADRRGQHDVVDRAFEDAIHGFEALGMRERVLQCHGAYAEILERRGELAKAYVHMKEALQASRPGLLKREKRQQRLSSA